MAAVALSCERFESCRRAPGLTWELLHKRGRSSGPTPRTPSPPAAPVSSSRADPEAMLISATEPLRRFLGGRSTICRHDGATRTNRTAGCRDDVGDLGLRPLAAGAFGTVSRHRAGVVPVSCDPARRRRAGRLSRSVDAPDEATARSPVHGSGSRPDMRDAADALHRRADRGATIAAACISAFGLAESGLLDDHDVTTTWWLAPLVRQRYPRVRLDDTRMVVRPGRRAGHA